MIGWLIFAGVGVLGYFALRPVVQQIRMGLHLTKLTNWVEQIELTRFTMPIGAGGGWDSLTPFQQAQGKMQFDRSIAALRAFPRHVVTRELIKNSILANRMGRQLRAQAIYRLIDVLVEADVAMGIEDFSKSYA